ncbi:hypothetical protein [Hymenobacter psoromatis]|uniref:hypothetical protein n=1 Tax=Hymenobacter psoromatis TaxID=1484116 RepID=UPI001CC1115C|nr:hypothetical protein [Hymenobacter psoromatis]
MTTLPAASPALPPAPRRAVPYPHAAAQHPPVRLTRQPTPPTGLRYALASYWEVRQAGQVRRTTLTKTLTLHWQPLPSGLARFSYYAAAPAFQQPEVPSLERILLRLADLYQHLELRATAAGQLVGLDNFAAITQTWAGLRAELRARSGGDDELTQALMTGLDAQLAEPGPLLASLRLDYAFAFLLPDVYGPRWESGWRYEQTRAFPHFFTDTDLWVSEQLEVGPPTAAGYPTLHLRGPLDAVRTDLAAVAQQIGAERLAADPAADLTDPPLPQARCEATYALDPATGWPLALDASVRCWAGDSYSKEYFLRLEQLPPA